jgi:arylamine N-acetyltransferase
LDRHPGDFLAPNHFTSTHPSSRFTNTLIVQRWREDAVQVGPVGLDLLVRDPYSQSRVAPGDLQSTPVDLFGLAFSSDEVQRVLLRLGERNPC